MSFTHNQPKVVEKSIKIRWKAHLTQKIIFNTGGLQAFLIIEAKDVLGLYELNLPEIFQVSMKYTQMKRLIYTLNILWWILFGEGRQILFVLHFAVNKGIELLI